MPTRSWRRPALAALVLAAGSAGSAAAHDFWIEPSSFTPRAGDEVAIGLNVGENLAGEPVPRRPGRIARFVVAGPDGERPVPGEDGKDPAGRIRIEAPGLHVVGYRSLTTRIDLDAAKFEAYLAEEGLESIVERRAGRGESGKPGREIYSRCAKALILAGPRPGPGDPGPAPEPPADRALGFTLELVAERSPYGLDASRELPVRILHEGKPLAGALVVALSREAPLRKQKHRSDAEGRAVLEIDRPGLWLVKAVHMVPAPPASGADWESLWASLTFEARQ
jgi:hypothetical protein